MHEQTKTTSEGNNPQVISDWRVGGRSEVYPSAVSGDFSSLPNQVNGKKFFLVIEKLLF